MSKPEQPPPYGFQHPPATCSLPPPMPIPTATVQFGPESQRLNCPYCHKDISSRIETAAVTKTHLFALLLCLFGCWPCVCIPYCMDSCMSTSHYCPSCNAFLGTYNQ